MINEDIFSVENKLLVINKDYVRGVSEFRTILERDKGSKGDVDGRKKFKAWKELFYIYMRASLFSYPNKGGYNEKDCHEAAIKEAKLEENYKPDESIRAAIDKYREIQLASLPTLASITTVLRALRLSDTICQDIIQDIEEKIDHNKVVRKKRKEREEKGDKIEPTNIADEMLVIEGLTTRLDKVMGTANKIPNIVETLEKLYERLRKDQSGDNLTRGGREKGNRADPR